MANIFKLLGSVIIDDDQAQSSLKKLEQGAEKASKKFSSIAQGMGAFGAGMTTAIGGAGTLLYQLGIEGEDAGIKIQTGLGLSAEEAEKFKIQAKGIYKEGFGESLPAVTDALVTVKQGLQDVNDADLGNVTKSMMNIAQLTGEDVLQVTRAVDQMQEHFGVSVAEAQDLIVKGQQKGLNYSNEMMDSILEYAPQFKNMGYSAEEMFNVFSAGAENGAFNLDKIGDAVKENFLRLSDMGKGQQSVMGELGISAEETMAKITAGGSQAQGAYTQVMTALAGVKDETERNRMGVELFGTQWEDLGQNVIMALDPAKGKIGEVKGATDELNNTLANSSANNFAETMRKLKDSLAPIAQAVLNLVNDNLPAIQNFATKAGQFIGGISPHVLKFVAVFGAIIGVVSAVATALAPVIFVIGQLIPIFVKVWQVISKVIAIVRSWGAVMGVIAGGPIVWIIAGVVALIAIIVLLWRKSEGFRNACASIWNGIKAVVGVAISVIMKLLRGLASFIGGVLTVVWNVVKVAWQVAWAVLGGIIRVAIAIIKGIVNTIKAIAGGVAKVWDLIKQRWSTVWGGMSKVVEKAVGLIKGAVGGINKIVDGVVNSIENAIDAIGRFMNKIGSKAFQGAVNTFNKITGGGGESKGKQKKNANGTDNFEGGWTVVGEQGRELVKLPQGSQITPNHELDGIGGKQVNQTLNFYGVKPNANEVARKTKQASQRLALE